MQEYVYDYVCVFHLVNISREAIYMRLVKIVLCGCTCL